MYKLNKLKKMKENEELENILNKFKQETIEKNDKNDKNNDGQIIEDNNQDMLKKKLRDKIKTKRESRPSMNQKEYNKMMNTLRKEMNETMKDERITEEMRMLYKKVRDEMVDIEIPTPEEIMKNSEIATEKFKEYLRGIVSYCKKNNITKEEFIEIYLNSNYVKYNVAVLGLEIIPEQLRGLVK